MALHEHERDLLEDTMYWRLAALWSEFSDAKRMQTVLLTREMARMMKLTGRRLKARCQHPLWKSQ